MHDDLSAADLRPRPLFEGDVDRLDRLILAFDVVNDRFRKFSAVPAVQGFRREWKARADNKSPSWTTRLDEVPVVPTG